MARITKEQYNKWNAQAHNGFKFDFRHYCIWNEKQLVKSIKSENGEIIEYTICYYPEFESYTNQYGCTYNRETGRQLPTLRVNRLIPTSTEGMYRSITVRTETIGEPQKTKNYNTLCKLSATVDTSSTESEAA